MTRLPLFKQTEDEHAKEVRRIARCCETCRFFDEISAAAGNCMARTYSNGDPDTEHLKEWHFTVLINDICKLWQGASK